MLRIGGIAFDLFTQAAHVHGDGAGIDVIGHAPHALQQLIAREDLPGMTRQQPEQIELFSGQRFFFAVEW